MDAGSKCVYPDNVSLLELSRCGIAAVSTDNSQRLVNISKNVFDTRIVESCVAVPFNRFLIEDPSCLPTTTISLDPVPLIYTKYQWKSIFYLLMTDILHIGDVHFEARRKSIALVFAFSKVHCVTSHIHIQFYYLVDGSS